MGLAGTSASDEAIGQQSAYLQLKNYNQEYRILLTAECYS